MSLVRQLFLALADSQHFTTQLPSHRAYFEFQRTFQGAKFVEIQSDKDFHVHQNPKNRTISNE